MNENAEREAFSRLITSAKMLLQNAVGCAVNHYGEDYSTHGEPGWIADCRADIVRAADVMQSRAALTPPPVQGEVTPGYGIREALVEAIDVLSGMAEDEIEEELLPRLRSALIEPAPAPAGVNAVEATKAAFDAFCRDPDPVVEHYHRGTKRTAFEAGARAVLAHLGIPDLSKQEG